MESYTVSEPLVSVIVPIYNAQRFLRDCLDSLLQQDLPSLEILCINDGSTDGSAEILAEYAATYPQVKPIWQENAGVSAARNKGLLLAKGKYIAFCDSDDFLMDGILGMTARYMEEYNAEIGFYDKVWVPESYGYAKERVPDQVEVTVGIDEHIQNTVEIFLMLVKREHLQKCDCQFHCQISYAEDALFMVDVMRTVSAETVIHVHQDGYFYRNNPASAMNADRVKRMPRHYQSMRLLAGELQKRLNAADKPEPPVEQHMRGLLNIAVCNALHDGMFLADRSPESILHELKKEGLYPQPFDVGHLKKRPMREMLYHYVRFLFPVPLYYSVISRIIRLMLKLKKSI